MSRQKPENNALTLRGGAEPSFDLLHALPGRTSSPHTHRAYNRWIDAWLADHAGLPRTRGDRRIARMRALPLEVLSETLSAARLRAWLGWLAEKGHSRSSIDQARAAVVTLTQLLVEAGWLDDVIGATPRVPARACRRPATAMFSSSRRRVAESVEPRASGKHYISPCGMPCQARGG